MKVAFTPEEKRIVNVLYAAHKPLTTKNVADRSEMAWQTAKKYLNQLHKKGYVLFGKYGKSMYWWLRV